MARTTTFNASFFLRIGLVAIFISTVGCNSGNQGTVKVPEVPSNTFEPKDTPVYNACGPVKIYTPYKTIIAGGTSNGDVKIFRPRTNWEDLYKNESLIEEPSRPAPIKVKQQPKAQPLVAPDAAWQVRLKRNWQWIVVHHSATQRGNAALFHKSHLKRGWKGLGYHFVICNGDGGADGKVEVGFRWRDQMHGAHTGEYNTNQFGVGICLVGDFNHGQPTAKQMTSLKRLVNYLRSATGVTKGNVIGHGDANPGHTQCPGKNFNVSAFRDSLSGGTYINKSPMIQVRHIRKKKSTNSLMP